MIPSSSSRLLYRSGLPVAQYDRYRCVYGLLKRALISYPKSLPGTHRIKPCSNAVEVLPSTAASASWAVATAVFGVVGRRTKILIMRLATSLS
eukprot:CAMPEP_0170196072 /NCGR_PEP_ID=MMETSP0040_2-20121228/62990_1 /TAXON_ID=641309 /ORGANISM="Lotharella oceanica, Strain CCMP622" /LENGTH=92 /DNA_ID=CAMNT_0010445397 /DNA_START=203 /DNA_END=481 /DNA_ORIENTATION=+